MVIKKFKESEITLNVTLLLPADFLYVNNVTGIVKEKELPYSTLYARSWSLLMTKSCLFFTLTRPTLF